jgi:hypothetical protein
MAAVLALVWSAACAPAMPAHDVHFVAAQHEQTKHHTKISPLGATGIAVLGAAVAGFAGFMIFVFPKSAG